MKTHEELCKYGEIHGSEFDRRKQNHSIAEQKAFERWYLSESPLNTVDKTPSGLASGDIYCKPATRRAWAAWKAGAVHRSIAGCSLMMEKFAAHTPENVQEIINLLRNADRPQELGSLADAAADALADCKYGAMLWEAFEEFQVDNDLVERTNQSIIQETEGNSDLDRYVASGDWETIFNMFLDEVRARLLKWPGTKDSSNG